MDKKVVFSDYPTNKYAKKVDWWTSPEGIELIKGWRQCGCTYKEITEHMGVDIRTFRSWRKKYPELEEALIIGMEITNTRMVNALYKKATGFYYDESVEELVEGKMRTTKIYHKYSPPDVKAILSWLYNRASGMWRAVQQPIDVSTDVIHSFDDVLVAIRSAAEGTSGKPEKALLDASTGLNNQEPVSTNEAKEDGTESLGEVPENKEDV